MAEEGVNIGEVHLSPMDGIKKEAQTLYINMLALPVPEKVSLRHVPEISEFMKGVMQLNDVMLIPKTREAEIPELPQDDSEIPRIIREKAQNLQQAEKKHIADLRDETMVSLAHSLDKYIHTMYAMPDKFGNDDQERRAFSGSLRERQLYSRYDREYLSRNAIRKNSLTIVISSMNEAANLSTIDPLLSANIERRSQQLLYLIGGDEAHGIPQYEQMNEAEKLAIIRISTDFAIQSLGEMFGNAVAKKSEIVT